jgi:hypothetical protein
MIYIIISNIGLALITIVMYIRYSHFQISSRAKIRELDKALKDKKQQKNEMEKELRAEIKSETEQVKSLLRELEVARKERQDEIKLRLQAQNQIDLAMQKINDVQSRVNEWKVVQDNALKSSQSTIMRFGDDLMQKINKGQKRENDESRFFIEQNMKGLQKEIFGIEGKIDEFKQKLSESSVVNKVSVVQEKKAPISIHKDPQEQEVKRVKIDEVARKSLNDVVSLIKVSGMKHLKDYVLATVLDEEKAKFMLCDLVLIRDKVAYFVDFKADRYFSEFEKLPQDKKEAATPLLKQKLDKYFAYISNPKYRSLIEKLLASFKIDYSEIKIIFAARKMDDLKLLEKMKYYDKAKISNIEILDVNGVNDLIL